MGLQFVDILRLNVSLFSNINNLGVSLGVWVAGGISGGHINPVVWFFLGISPPTTQTQPHR